MFNDSKGSMFSPTCNIFLLSQTLVNLAARYTFAEKISPEDPIWGHQVSMAADLARAQAYYPHRRSSSQLSVTSVAHLHAISYQGSAEQNSLCAAPSEISPSLVLKPEDLHSSQPMTADYIPSVPSSPALNTVPLHVDAVTYIVDSFPANTHTNAMAGYSTVGSILTPPDTPEDLQCPTIRVHRHSERLVNSTVTLKYKSFSANASSSTRKGKRKTYEDEDDEGQDESDSDYTGSPPPSKRLRASSTQAPATPPAPTNNKYCHICKLRFKRLTDFDRHVESSKRHNALASKRNGTDLQMATYECERCSARFTRKDALKRHRGATCV